MSDAEHRVAMHHLVTERKMQGKPVWRLTVKGFGDVLGSFDGENLIEVRDRIVRLLRNSRWSSDDLTEVLDELADVGHPEIDWDERYDPEQHLRDCIESIYDPADWDRVWLEP